MARLGIALVLLVFNAPIYGGELPRYIPKDHREVLMQWLKANPSLRLATDSDCQCNDDIVAIRRGTKGAWKGNPSFHPYYVSGDFNQDGIRDFAAVVIGADGVKTALVFNGPFPKQSAPGFVFADHRGALFFGAPRSKPYHLVIGEFNSEGVALIPSGSTYSAKPYAH